MNIENSKENDLQKTNDTKWDEYKSILQGNQYEFIP